MKLVVYTRVSTQKQGDSGLGLEAQLAAINSYAASVSGDVVHCFKEIESGKRKDRPELAKAVALTKRLKARLVIAKLDRLARNVAFISALMESKVDFVCVDNVHANRLTLHLLAAVAEHEAQAISDRTKAALAAAKARGTQLGSARPGHWRGHEAERKAGALAGGKAAALKIRELSAPVYAEAMPVIREGRGQGRSLREIADDLNNKGLVTVTGRPWNPVQVSRLVSA
jgi:DNA invertase Pin-like site-specific DNA recombinase